ncbi:MAG: ABC-type sugar transport system periplasmic component-like protein [Actinomycetia bacterium]|nr:ABC-type sugar transport system periplasmic component-like protein [Actinomycetes bacterium]
MTVDPSTGQPDAALSRRSLLRGAVTVGAGLAFGPTLLAACGGGDGAGAGAAGSSSTLGAATASKSSGSDAIAAARQRLDAARAVPTFLPPGPAIDASSLAGKKLFYLAITFNVEIVQNLYKGVREAAQAVGMTAKSYDCKGDPSLYVAGFEQAINQGYDCVLLESIPNSLVAEPMRRAIDAGIKVVMINEVMETGPGDPRAHAQVAFDYVGGALLDADWVLNDSGGKDINLVVFHAENLRHRAMAKAIKDRIESSCVGGCKVRLEQVNYADFATRLPTLTQTLVTSDASINYMIPVIDGMSLNIVPGIRQAGAADRVKVASYNGTGSVLEMLGRGEVVGADIGGPHAWEGWLDVDAAIRVLLDQPPPAGEVKPPNRLFDSTNIGTLDLGAAEGTWYNTDAAKAGFRKLWNVA